jgi:hypothetical protein
VLGDQAVDNEEMSEQQALKVRDVLERRADREVAKSFEERVEDLKRAVFGDIHPKVIEEIWPKHLTPEDLDMLSVRK